MNEITKSKVIMSFDVAEKELARANENSLINQKRSLNRAERTSIRALIAYKSYILCVSGKLIECMLADHFGYEKIDYLDASQYDEAIVFLVDLVAQ